MSADIQEKVASDSRLARASGLMLSSSPSGTSANGCKVGNYMSRSIYWHRAEYSSCARRRWPRPSGDSV